MLIDFQMSGGYGGLFTAEPLRLHLDTESLPSTDREEVEALVASSRLLDPVGDEPAGSGLQRDALRYRISIAGQRSVARDFDDVTMPAEARGLIEKLRSLALEARSENR